MLADKVQRVLNCLTEVQRCPNCAIRIRFGDLDCPRCGADLEHGLLLLAERVVEAVMGPESPEAPDVGGRP